MKLVVELVAAAAIPPQNLSLQSTLHLCMALKSSPDIPFHRRYLLQKKPIFWDVYAHHHLRPNLPHSENYLLAAGLENGTISLMEFNAIANEVTVLRMLDRDMAFAGPVKAIRQE